jgi:uncharacterized protein YerC
VFKSSIQTGLNCSPFESEAILRKVHDIYEMLFDGQDILKPGQLRLAVVSVEAHAGQKLIEAGQIAVVLTFDACEEDLDIRQKAGISALRRHRMIRMSTEALQQGGVLTLEDFAYRLFNCGIRTLCRDLEVLRSKGITVPLRSTIKDMGRTLSHRTDIVRAWLQGKEYCDISRETHHSIAAVRNYVDKFKRVATLKLQHVAKEDIAFLVGISVPLAEKYIALLEDNTGTTHRQEELQGNSLKKKVYNKKRGNND